MRFERPTVSIQNGLPICARIWSDSALSPSEKNGFGLGGGSGVFGSISASIFIRSAAMRDSVALSRG